MDLLDLRRFRLRRLLQLPLVFFKLVQEVSVSFFFVLALVAELVHELHHAEFVWLELISNPILLSKMVTESI